jgi:hypothetical protein
LGVDEGYRDLVHCQRNSRPPLALSVP